MTPLTWLPRPATPASKPETTPQPGLRWPSRSTNFHPLPAGLAYSRLLISPGLSCVRATSPTRAATPPPRLTYSSGVATPQAPHACAHSALPQLDRSAHAPCAFSTNTSLRSPLDDTSEAPGVPSSSRPAGISRALRCRTDLCTAQRESLGLFGIADRSGRFRRSSAPPQRGSPPLDRDRPAPPACPSATHSVQP
jgi:hypothetical protein